MKYPFCFNFFNYFDLVLSRSTPPYSFYIFEFYLLFNSAFLNTLQDMGLSYIVY